MTENQRERLVKLINRVPVNLAVIILCLFWLLPTFGLLITSFRPRESVDRSGWWTVLNDHPGASAYDASCQNCHGDDFDDVPEVDLSNPDVISQYRRSSALIATYDEVFDGEVHIPEDQRPDRTASANILEYLQYQSGVQESPPTFTLSNYKDVLVGYVGSSTYEKECDEYHAELEEYEAMCRANPGAAECENPAQSQPQPPGTFTCESVLRDMTESSRNSIFRSLWNSFAVSVPSTILPLLFAGFAAYAFTWFDFAGRRVMFALLVGLQIVPLQMTLVPIFRIYEDLGLNGTFLGVWLFHTGFGMPYSIYLMRNFISRLPRDLFESAYLDGANHFTVFRKVVVPLSLPAIAALAIFQFLWVWNDLLVALIFLSGRTPVLTYTLSTMVDSLGIGWHRMTAAAFITIAVPLFVFIAFQRYFVQGLLAGSVKG